MDAYDIDPGVPAAIANFRPPERLGFGQINAPVMFDAEWRDGAWQRGRCRSGVRRTRSGGRKN